MHSVTRNARARRSHFAFGPESFGELPIVLLHREADRSDEGCRFFFGV
jgi:hypothetical protein